MSMRPLTVLFAGGGTAGHLLPAMATEEQLHAMLSGSGFDQLNAIYLATKSGAELPLLKKAHATFRLVPKTDFPRKLNGDLLSFLPRLIIAVVKTRKTIKSLHVDVVVGFGGYVALPAYCAAKLAKTPLVIHEANALPGLANRVGKWMATQAFSNFSIPEWNDAPAIGLPIRQSIADISKLNVSQREECKSAARAHFGLEPNRKTMLIFGGSLGAAKVNEVIAPALDEIVARGFQILHAVGAGNSLPLRSEGYHPVPYIDQMDQAFLAADLVVARSGAGTCAEIEASALPAVLIPLPIGNGEQLLNAKALAHRGGVQIIKNESLSRDALMSAISTLESEGFTKTSDRESAAAILAMSICQLASERKRSRKRTA